jgi:hypothetical protein
MIGVRVGKVVNKYKVGKHFDLVIEDAAFTFNVNAKRISAEAAQRASAIPWRRPNVHVGRGQGLVQLAPTKRSGAPANDPQQSWGFEGKLPEAVTTDTGTRDTLDHLTARELITSSATLAPTTANPFSPMPIMKTCPVLRAVFRSSKRLLVTRA